MPYSGLPTPDMPESEIGFVCKPIFVPDMPELWRALYGQITELCKERYWSHVGTMTPEDAAFLWARALGMTDLNDFCSDEESDDCIEYPTNAEFITYLPKDPYTGIGSDTGYLLPPFIRFGDILPDMSLGFVEELTGYRANDILVLIGSLPLGAEWDELVEALTNGLPRVEINVTGSGRVLIHFVLVPFGGRVLISLDDPLNILEIFTGLITDGYRTIELERDLSSFPPEDDSDHIEEIEFDTEGEHTIYLYFVPALDDAFIPAGFGGGIRSIEVCLNDESDIMIDCGDFQDCYEDNPDNVAMQNIVLTNMDNATEQFLADLDTLYDDTNPNSINDAIPTIPPDTDEKEALCWAIETWLNQYATAKTSKIRAASGLSQAWDAIQSTIVDAYGILNNVLGFLPLPDLFGCFVDNATALAALADSEAMELVKCKLYEELAGISLVEGSLEGAINAAVADLTDTAQDIACMLDNDYSLETALNFFFLYGRALDNDLTGDCSMCDEPTIYGYDDTDFTAEAGFYTFANGRDSNGALFSDAGSFKQSLAQYIAPANNEILFLEVLIARAGGSGGINDSWAIRTNMGTNGVFVTGDTKYDETALSNSEAWRCWRPSVGSAFRQMLLLARVQDNGAGSTIYIKRVKITTLNVDTGMTTTTEYPSACP